MRALFSGVTGIRSHQVRMDVIGNNIANVNTTGFKSSRVTFMDVFSQTLSQGSSTTTPQQVGLGSGVASTDLNQTAGSLQLTGRDLDIAIEGNGFFVMKGVEGLQIYTRAGSFDWDAQGSLVNPGNGQRVQGWMADASGSLANTDPASIGDIRLRKGDVALAEATTEATFGQNLDAGAANGTTYDTAFTAYDSLGRPQPIAVRFTKTATNTWDWSYQDPAGGGFTNGGTLSFGTDGTLPSNMAATSIIIPVTGANDLSISIDLKSITQSYAGTSGSTVLVRESDGNPMGTLESVSVDASGVVTGVYSNGFRRNLAQLSIATFNNPSGLMKQGASSFSESSASGSPIIGKPGSGGRGRLVPGNLEMSNVDLSTEFTSMIMTQRGFQANTRIITASDEMIQDLVNLRR